MSVYLKDQFHEVFVIQDPNTKKYFKSSRFDTGFYDSLDKATLFYSKSQAANKMRLNFSNRIFKIKSFYSDRFPD